MALNFLLTQQYEPQFEHSHEPQEMTEEFARQLADYFPVRSHFDEMQLFERPNMIALWFPVSPFNYDAPAFHLMARRRRDLDKFSDQFQVFG